VVSRALDQAICGLHGEASRHWVRDVTFAEDSPRFGPGTGPHIMACLPNPAIGVLSRAGRQPRRCAPLPRSRPCPTHHYPRITVDESDITTERRALDFFLLLWDDFG
jgi:hypothetical protein